MSPGALQTPSDLLSIEDLTQPLSSPALPLCSIPAHTSPPSSLDLNVHICKMGMITIILFIILFIGFGEDLNKLSYHYYKTP